MYIYMCVIYNIQGANCLHYMLIVTVFQSRFSDLCSQSRKSSYFNFLKHIYFKRQSIKNIVKCLHKKTQSNDENSVLCLCIYTLFIKK